MYICADCLHTFERAERKIDRNTYEESYHCPICGSDNIEFATNRKENEDDTDD
jgi:DNA-directed RNA polymerase subunit RPC12/RpoP